MFSRGLRQFFIEEVAQLIDDSYVIPHNWIVRAGKLCADCSDVVITTVGPVFFPKNYLTPPGRLDGQLAQRRGVLTARCFSIITTTSLLESVVKLTGQVNLFFMMPLRPV